MMGAEITYGWVFLVFRGSNIVFQLGDFFEGVGGGEEGWTFS